MAKMSAPARDERRHMRGAVDPVANERPVAGEPAVDQALDSEMLDLVQRFERGYAELSPAVEEPARNAPVADELFPEFPDIFDEPPAKPSAESARVFAMPRREADGASPAWPRETPVADRDADVDLDEAMAILRASEQRTSTASARTQIDEEPKSAPRAWRSEFSVRPTDMHAAQARAGEGRSWASRSHGRRTAALAAAVTALVVGVAAGYFLGHSPSPRAPSAVIESSGAGGTQLKLDQQLRTVK